MHQFLAWIAWYRGWTHWAQYQVGPDKFLHVSIGLGVWLLTVIISGRPLRDPRTLIPILIMETGNELADYINGYKWTLLDTLGDIWWTFFWPLVIIALLHRRRERDRG